MYQLLLRATTHPRGRDVPSVEMAEICAILSEMHEKHFAWAHIDKDDNILEPEEEITDDRNVVYIRDQRLDEDRGLHTFLFHRADPNEADPALINVGERKSETVPVGRKQAPGRSAHLILSLSPTPTGQYRAVLEQATGINRGLIARFINHIMREEASDNPKYTYQMKVKRGRYETRAYQPRFRVDAQLSADLIQDIKEGTVSSVDLIERATSYNGPDLPKEFAAKSKRLTLDVKENATKDQIVKALRKVAGVDAYDDIQVHLRDLPGDTTSSPRIAREKFEANEILYTRKVIIDGFAKPLSTSCFDSIHDEIEQKMQNIIKNGRW
ncbi:hypothetical protein [Marinicauda salina]|uniref:hypothetical protein n=1 Tax=Marinicauda salina TaxID=2135793 RepID=UPI0011B1C9AD|nr:hypothetical protein [Marinicauda salina]